MGLPTIDIIILNYNTIALLQQLLPLVIKHSQYPNTRVVVADNCSNDGSASWVKQHLPQITLIELEANYGYAGGYNRAIAQSTADYIVLLNSDAEPHENWLAPMIQLLESNEKIGALQPKLLDFYKRNFFEYAGGAGGYMDEYGFPFCMGRIFGKTEEDQGQYNQTQRLFWATGAALIVRKSAWDIVNGLDEHFFAHMEEIDLCWRMQCKGYEIYSCPESIVYHMGGATLSNINPRKTFLNFRNGLFMLHKNLHPSEKNRVIFKRKLLDGLAGVFFILQGKFTHCLQIYKAHRAFDKEKQDLILTTEPKKLTELKGILKGSLVFAYFLGNKKITSRLIHKISK